MKIADPKRSITKVNDLRSHLHLKLSRIRKFIGGELKSGLDGRRAIDFRHPNLKIKVYLALLLNVNNGNLFCKANVELAFYLLFDMTGQVKNVFAGGTSVIHEHQSV